MTRKLQLFGITIMRSVSFEFDTFFNLQSLTPFGYHLSFKTIGITRLNVYAGLAAFYILRDSVDTGDGSNTCGLPYGNQEALFAIQDRMFKSNGALFYPAFPGDPAYDQFIEEDEIDADLANKTLFPYPAGRGPQENGGVSCKGSCYIFITCTALTSVYLPSCCNDSLQPWRNFSVRAPQRKCRILITFCHVHDDSSHAFSCTNTGDHMLVNGKLWPTYSIVNLGWYRLRFLNGCDSRFLVVNFRQVSAGATEVVNTDPVVPYYVIAGDQGFVWSGADSPRTGPLVIAPGNRYDIVINFADLPNMASGPWRVIMTNQGGDEPFRGDIVGTVAYPRMQSIMAFDSTYTNSPIASNGDPSFLRCVHGKGRSMVGFPTKTRRLALFEGADEHGRLQPLLGTLDDAKDEYGNTILWPNDPAYVKAGLAGQPMSGTMPWHAPETEIINKDTIEEWEICK